VVYAGNSLGYGVAKRTLREMKDLYTDDGLLDGRAATYTILPCSQQDDGLSCGVYSIAYCTLFAVGATLQEVREVEFDTASLWKWFRKVFSAKFLETFLNDAEPGLSNQADWAKFAPPRKRRGQVEQLQSFDLFNLQCVHAMSDRCESSVFSMG
jgi:hypothetical protein